MNDFENILQFLQQSMLQQFPLGGRKNIWLQRNVDSLSAIPNFLSVSPRGFFARKTRFPKKNIERFNSAVVLAVDSIIIHVIVIIIVLQHLHHHVICLGYSFFTIMILTLTLTIMIIITTDHRQAATIAAELLRGGTSPTAEALVVPQANCHLHPHHQHHCHFHNNFNNFHSLYHRQTVICIILNIIVNFYFHNEDGDVGVLTVLKSNHNSHFDNFAEHASVASTRARRLTKGAACLLVPGLSLAAHICFFCGGRITKIFCF